MTDKREFSDALKGAVEQALKDAAKKSVDAGRSVHFIDSDGDICERLSTGETRKMSKSEIDAFLVKRRVAE